MVTLQAGSPSLWSLSRLEVPVRAAVKLEVVPSLQGDGEEEGVRGVFFCCGFVVFYLERSHVLHKGHGLQIIHV